jgi:hypothetical protein
MSVRPRLIHAGQIPLRCPLSICGRPFGCKRFCEVLTRGRLLPSVRPVCAARGLLARMGVSWTGCHITQGVLASTVESPGLPGPVLPTVAPYPPSTATPPTPQALNS